MPVISIVECSIVYQGAIIIHEVYEDGAAARDGRLWAGDQILEVPYVTVHLYYCENKV